MKKIATSVFVLYLLLAAGPASFAQLTFTNKSMPSLVSARVAPKSISSKILHSVHTVEMISDEMAALKTARENEQLPEEKVLTNTEPAQNNAQSVYELIKTFAPAATAPSIAADWKTGAASSVKWLSPAPKKTPIGYIRSGTVMAAMQKPTPCSIDLTGASLSGYTEINITVKPPVGKDGDYAYDAVALFGSMAAQARLLKKDDGGYPMYNYQLAIPGKKPLWLIVMLDTGGAHGDEDAATVNIICLSDKKEFDKRTAY